MSAAAVAMSPSLQGIIQVVNESNLCKIESFLNDAAYREAIENSSNYNSRLCRERRLRMPFLDSQTGVAQNHSALFMSSRERLPGLLHGQVYTYPSKRWRKKRRQYLMHYLHPKRGPRGETDDNGEGIETVAHINDDSKDSVGLKDEHSKDAWYYDEQDMIDMDTYDEPDPESDYDYEESYSSKRKKRKPRGGGHHPTRNHPPSSDSPGSKRTKGGGRGRKKTTYDAVDSDKPFVCDRGTRRGRQNATASTTSSQSPVATSSPAVVATAQPQQPVQQSSQPQPQPQVPAHHQPSPQSQSQSQSQTQPQSQHHHHHHHHLHHQQQSQQPSQHSPPQQQQPSPQSQQQQQQVGPIPVGPGSPTISTNKDEHLSAAPSPGQGVPSPTSTAIKPMDGSGTGLPGTNEKKPGKSAQPSPYCDFCLGDARENKKTGGSEELVSCSDCGRSGHPTCLQFTANMIVSVRKYRWQCIECKCCSICGTSDNDDQLLFCDDCDRGYHMYCLSPPLASPPEGSWSCRLCITEFHRRD